MAELHIEYVSKDELRPYANNAKIHTAMFPVELPWRCIKMHSDKDDNILEPFCGSGTTIIACEQTGRICYAVERDPRYCDVTIDRWEKFTGQKAVLLNG